MAAKSTNKTKYANIVNKLFLRETRGSLQTKKGCSSQRIFTKIPGRLCYRLRSLVSQDVLEEGHVFLGFTKCGQYVVSYTCQVDADEHTAFPIYLYKLQWWWFVPSRPLKMISEVRLFGEDVVQDLFISFCEWPGDRTKVLVFGHSLPIQNQDSCCQCYVTITAVPTLHSCLTCHQLNKDCKESEVPQKCLAHSFTVHTKFELTPPFPPFLPVMQLKIDGIAVVNTGDSIVALVVNLDGSISKMSQTIGFDTNNHSDSESVTNGNEVQKMETTKVYSKPLSSTSSTNVCCECGKQVANSSCSSPRQYEPKIMDENQKENIENCVAVALKSPKSPRSPKSPMSNISDSTSHNSNCCKHGNTCISSQDWFETLNSEPNSDLGMAAGSSASVVHELHMEEQNVDKENEKVQIEPIKCLKSPKSENFNEFKCNSPKTDSLNLPQRSSPLQNSELVSIIIENSECSTPPVCSPFRTSSICNCPSSTGRQNSQRSFFSPSNSGSTSGTSKSTDSFYLHVNESRTVTYSLRKFSHITEDEEESPNSVEDDLDLAYRSVLPLEVLSSGSRRLSPQSNKHSNKNGLQVSQMTFDVEHYLEEVISHHAEWGHCYVAFTNYDLQILDVCPVNCAVMGKVFALIHAREQTDKKVKRSKSAIKLYQTSFNFTWNLKNGSYETLHVDTLTEVDECEIRRKEWKPGYKECVLLRRELFVPNSAHKCVNVLSNESVFKGKSLAMIVSPQQYVAILM